MSAERRMEMIRDMELTGMTVTASESRGRLVVTVSDHRGQVARVHHIHRFDIEAAHREWVLWRCFAADISTLRPRTNTRIFSATGRERTAS